VIQTVQTPKIAQIPKKLAGTLSTREDHLHLLKIMSVAKRFIAIRISEGKMLCIDLNIIADCNVIINYALILYIYVIMDCAHALYD